MLQEVGTDGLIALSGAALGDVGEALLSGNRLLAECRAKAWAAMFPDAYYLKSSAPATRNRRRWSATADLAGELGLPLVATHPIQYLTPDDFKAHEARVCIAEGYVCSVIRADRSCSPSSSISSRRPRWPNCLPICRKRSITRSGSLAAATSKSPSARTTCRSFPTPEGVTSTTISATRRRRGWKFAWRSSTPIPGCANASVRRTTRA